MYERFTDRARKVMQLANQEAQRLNHEYIGTEHILLGLVKEGSGVAANVLKILDIDLRLVRVAVEKIAKRGPDRVTMGKLPQTPRAKKVIEYSVEEARNLNHNYVGTEHLLLGLIREEEGAAAQILLNFELGLELVRRETLRLLAAPPGEALSYGGRSLAWPPRPSADPAFRRTLRTLREIWPRGSADPQVVVPEARLFALERQLATVRFLLGAALGVTAGTLVGGRDGALVGLLAGATLAYVGRMIPAAVAGGLAGAFVGAAHLADLGGGYAGAALGALLAGCVTEVGRVPRSVTGNSPPAKPSVDA